MPVSSSRVARALVALLAFAAPAAVAERPDLADGEARYAAGAYAEAERAFRDAAAAAPDDGEARFRLGRALMAQGRWADAVEALEIAIELTPGNARFHRLLGEALGRHAEVASLLKRLGLAKRGLSYFERAVALDPYDLEARDSLMEYYLQAPGFAGGSEAKAVDQAETVKAFAPAAGWRLHGRIHHHEKRWDAARAAYERALEADPDHLLAHFGLALLAVDREQWDAAFAALDALLARDADHALGRYELGRAAALSGRRAADGMAALAAYADRPRPAFDPPRSEALLMLAQLQAAAGDPDAARRSYDRLLALDPDHRRARRERARLP